jgi:hypothetical protein
MLELKGMTDFKPTADIAQFLDSQKESSLNVRFGNLAQGPITVKTVKKGQYRIKEQPIPLSHPLFARAAETLPGLTPSLVLDTDKDKLKGSIGLVAGKKIEQLASRLAKAPEMLGLAGFKINSPPKITNKLEGGSLHLGLANVPIRLGSAFSGNFTLTAIDESVTFSANVTIVVKGLEDGGTLDLKRAPDGAVTGKATLGVSLAKNITGAFDVAWDGRAINGQGKVGYKGEKLSGEVTLHLMEKSQAEQLEAASKAPEGKVAPATSTEKKSPPAKVDYVVFGDGNLIFAFNEWLNGNAQVIINPKGYLTVIGKITPQKEFILFEQKDYVKPLFKLEARASYGIPVVGNIFIFANVGMDAFAKLGPGKFHKIEVDGTYSTDPKQANNFTIRGSLNISAAAGLRLRAEAGAGLEILDHDIKAGAGINGIAGIKAYAEATPIIGYREKGAEGEDKKGEFFIRGELEIAGQPFLGLSGDLFVAIETPWWSPLSDKRWTWPLFSKEWPIGGSLGIGASVDYVFGSGQLPKLDFKPVDFSAEKFMTDMYTDKAKSGPGKEVEKKGDWKEKNSAAAEAPPKVSAPGNATKGKLDQKSPLKSKNPTTKKSGKAATDDATTADGKNVGDLKKKKKPGKDLKTGGDKRTDEEKLRDVRAAASELESLAGGGLSGADLEHRFPAIKTKYRLTNVKVEHAPTGFRVWAEINPRWKTKIYPEGETKYTITENGKRVLRPKYRGSAKIRTRLYSSSNNAPIQKIIATQTASLVRQKNPRTGAWEPAPSTQGAQFWQPIPGEEPMSYTAPRTRPTLEHETPVVGHWNNEGNNCDQQTRIRFYRFVGRESSAKVLPFYLNREEGSHGEPDYTIFLGVNFKEPGE